MSSPALDAFYAELLEYRERLSPVEEGLKDYSRLDLQDNTHGAVRTGNVEYETLAQQVDQAIAAVEALARGPYPVVLKYKIPITSLQDLTENATTILAALDIFSAMEEAAEAVIIPGVPEPKEPDANGQLETLR